MKKKQTVANAHVGVYSRLLPVVLPAAIGFSLSLSLSVDNNNRRKIDGKEMGETFTHKEDDIVRYLALL